MKYAILSLFLTLSFSEIIFSQTLNSGAFAAGPEDELMVAVRYRTIRALGQTNAPGDEYYLGCPDLGVAANRKARDFSWGQSSSWDFTFRYDPASDALTTSVTNGAVTYRDTIPNLTSFVVSKGKTNPLSSMNYMNMLVRTGDAVSTVSVSNLTLNGTPISSVFSASGGENMWNVTSFNFGAGFLLEGKITTSGTFSASQENNKIEFAIGKDNAPLPLTWGNMNASREGDYVNLYWETLSEKNTDRFEVEVSDDGTSFEKIGEVSASGNSSSTLSYRFVHYNSKNSIQYYRIRQVDLDQKFSYSKILVAAPAGSYAQKLRVSNPVGSEINIFFRESGLKNIKVADVNGKVLLDTRSGGEHVVIPADTLPRGVYLLIAESTDGQYVGREKLIKQ